MSRSERQYREQLSQKKEDDRGPNPSSPSCPRGVRRRPALVRGKKSTKRGGVKNKNKKKPLEKVEEKGGKKSHHLTRSIRNLLPVRPSPSCEEKEGKVK